MSKRKKHIIVTAGGTGGHTFPAEATATALIAKGYRVTLVTDKRYFDYRTPPEGLEVEVIQSASPSGGIINKIKALFAIGKGLFQALWIFYNIRPVAVIGFGGYPSFPMVAVAGFKSIPLLIQEQNAFLGKVNRFGAKYARVLATAYDEVKGAPDNVKMVKTGNPLRQAFIELRDTQPYQLPKGKQPFHILITGGSQGASIFSQIVPEAMKEIHAKHPALHITHQCRKEELAKVEAFYQQHVISAEVVSFIDDMPNKMRSAHIAIARAGASTISEMTALGVPAIFVPLPYAADDHQTKNAEAIVKHGAAKIIKQAEFTSKTLVKEILPMLDNPQSLKEMAENALQLGVPNATEKLVTLIEEQIK